MAALNKHADKKIIGDDSTKEEAVTYVIEKLSEDDWRRCEAHKGDASPNSFLYILSESLLIEYTRKKFGRIRPPEWLKREGTFWVRIWQEVCLNRLHEQTVFDRHCSDSSIASQNSDAGLKDPMTVKNIMRTIKAKLPWCGVSNMPELMDDEANAEKDYFPESATINDALRRESYDQFLHLAQLMLSDEPTEIEHASSQKATSEKICELVESLGITNEERLMLRMFYVDALSHSAIARLLGVAKHIPARQNKKVLQRLQEALAQHRLELE
jgi:DNA-directed RNA polymerase specialized sigma24 family protein